ncbi:MAG: hypothetical protein HY543_04500 [Deltaproteobacteria bacterium]|nr:hypothetical protein [Deltaproteobacteria bacterium]
MKTSLILDDRVFQAAKRESQRSGRSLSALISDWARIGLETLKHTAKRKHRQLKTVDLGGPARLDLNSRRDWMDTLDR